MDRRVRTAFLWQLAGGIVAVGFIVASLAQLLWWSLYLSDPINVTRSASIIVHVGSALALLGLIIYLRFRKQRERAMAGVSVPQADAPAFTMIVLSYPVHVQWWFFVAATLLAFRSKGVVQFIAFAALTVFGILTHELGHAVAATRMKHQDVEIHLHAFGGLTTSIGPAERAPRAAILLAGPAVGVFLGVLTIAIGELVPFLHAHWLYRPTLMVTLGWSIANLLPIYPLDGGQLLALVLKDERHVPAISVLLSAIGAGIAFAFGYRDAGALFIAFGLLNVLAVPKIATWIEGLKQRA